MTGKVYLVGAGPGDPELITVRGQYLLVTADCILYDNLATPLLLEHAKPGAEKIYVGKKRSDHTCTVEEIIATMVDRARQGLTVIRLKGGDPFIFGRGGEEVEGLVAAGVPCEVVPGVTTPLGIAAYTGVPLTHREHTSVVTFVTGHDPDAIDWTRIGAGTLVVFMGLSTLREIASRLIAAGRSPDTPAMAVRWATRPDQKTVTGTLADIADRVANEHLHPPATIVIGEVVRLHGEFDWFERRPLFGQRIIVTRPKQQAFELWHGLTELGADVVVLPVIELRPLADYSRLDESLRRLPDYDWVIFTSTNAVEFFMDRLEALDRDNRSLRGRVCAIGQATARRLREYGIRPDLVPEEATSEGVAAAFAPQQIEGCRVLLPRAAAAREVIPTALTELGAQVDIVDTYRNVVPADAEIRIREYAAPARKADWITFTSGSTVRNWLALAGRDSLAGVRIASIGPATSEVLRNQGLTVDAEAEPHTVEALIEAIEKSHFR
jgi:uroporphyrinogen III methyltransferase/synthase